MANKQKFILNFEFEAVGFKNGQLQIVDAVSLSDCLKGPFNYSKESIEHIEFSHDSEYLATAVSSCYSSLINQIIFLNA